MKLTDAVAAGLVATAAVEAVKSVHGMLPPLTDVSDAHAGTPSATPVRHGQLAAAATAVAIGGAIAITTGSFRPLAAAALAAAVLLVFYEWLLHRKG